MSGEDGGQGIASSLQSHSLEWFSTQRGLPASSIGLLFPVFTPPVKSLETLHFHHITEGISLEMNLYRIMFLQKTFEIDFSK